MKAQDKIYIDIIDMDSGYMMAPSFENNGGVEYIRKYALLEWAKAEIDLSKRVECVSEKSYEEGRQQVAQNLIDKLNSM